MTLRTIQRPVYARQRETALEVQLRDPVHQPVGGSMATRTIGAQRLLVHIGMAGNTFPAGFGKNQAFVAGPAVNVCVLTLQGKFRFTMVKTQRIGAPGHARHAGKRGLFRVKILPVLRTDFPARRGMAGGA